MSWRLVVLAVVVAVSATLSTRMAPLSRADAPQLSAVARWLYLIDSKMSEETVGQIAASDYDLVVLDYVTSGRGSTDYPMAETISRLHNAPHPKLVVAYIDIGQAEDYRTYWQRAWRVGSPDWITGDDPDGWTGSYPVAFWRDAWRQIWVGDGGYLGGIVAAGFDGVYLDWIEAYNDPNVVALARTEGRDPRGAMLDWVEEIARFGRDRKPGFLVIGQNALDLAADDRYLAAVDAVAQEQVWFDGAASNDPPGDCPLPATNADVDTSAYRSSLSPACRRQLEHDTASSLHVSTEHYLRQLSAVQAHGKIVLTVDYALEPTNVAHALEAARALGFVPFVSGRALDTYVPPR